MVLMDGRGEFGGFSSWSGLQLRVEIPGKLAWLFQYREPLHAY